MTNASTTIRVTVAQRDQLRALAEQRAATMSDTLDAALESLARDRFYTHMASAEADLRRDSTAWSAFKTERDTWLNADLA
jgi:hypothetical protein